MIQNIETGGEQEGNLLDKNKTAMAPVDLLPQRDKLDRTGSPPRNCTNQPGTNLNSALPNAAGSSEK